MQTKAEKQSQLQPVLDKLLSELEKHEPDSKEYGQILDHVMSLHKMTEDEKPHRVSPDTLVLAGANLLGILMILKYEHANVITSKAMSFIRLR